MSVWAGEYIDAGTPLLEVGANPPYAWLRFNNAAKHNAVSLEMWAGIAQALEQLAARDDIRVLVISGAGGKAFASGADISQFEKERGDQEAAERYGEISGKGFAAISQFPRPTIAMIEGYCIGGGLALALTCDIRIAAEGSVFAIPAARLGLAYPPSGLANLIHLVGPAYAREIMFTARRYSGEEAERMGLINRLTPRAALEETVTEYASKIAENAPLTIAAARLVIAETLKDPAQRNPDLVSEAVSRCMESADYKEGRTAFMEKRTPQFRGV